MDAKDYQAWLDQYSRDFPLDAFANDAEGEPFKIWREALTPLLIDEATRRGDDYPAFRGRLVKTDQFLTTLYWELTGVWERYKNDGTTDRETKFIRPRYWWTHFKLGSYLKRGTEDGIEYIEVNENNLVGLATEYLSMPWLRHPRLDWLFVDLLLFLPTFDAVERARVTLAQQAMLGDREKVLAGVKNAWLSELRWSAAKGRLKSKVMGHAVAWSVGLIGPVVALAWLSESNVEDWLAWVIVVPSALLLLLTAWSVLWWFFGGVRRALGGKDTRPESPAKLAQRLEAEAQAWLGAYELLSASAIPVDELRKKVATLPLQDGKKLPACLLALLARIAEKDGAVWVPFPR